MHTPFHGGKGGAQDFPQRFLRAHGADDLPMLIRPAQAGRGALPETDVDQTAQVGNLGEDVLHGLIQVGLCGIRERAEQQAAARRRFAAHFGVVLEQGMVGRHRAGLNTEYEDPDPIAPALRNRSAQFSRRRSRSGR